MTTVPTVPYEGETNDPRLFDLVPLTDVQSYLYHGNNDNHHRPSSSSSSISLSFVPVTNSVSTLPSSTNPYSLSSRRYAAVYTGYPRILQNTVTPQLLTNGPIVLQSSMTIRPTDGHIFCAQYISNRTILLTESILSSSASSDTEILPADPLLPSSTSASSQTQRTIYRYLAWYPDYGKEITGLCFSENGSVLVIITADISVYLVPASCLLQQQKEKEDRAKLKNIRNRIPQSSPSSSSTDGGVRQQPDTALVGALVTTSEGIPSLTAIAKNAYQRLQSVKQAINGPNLTNTDVSSSTTATTDTLSDQQSSSLVPPNNGTSTFSSTTTTTASSLPSFNFDDNEEEDIHWEGCAVWIPLGVQIGIGINISELSRQHIISAEIPTACTWWCPAAVTLQEQLRKAEQIRKRLEYEQLKRQNDNPNDQLNDDDDDDALLDDILGNDKIHRSSLDNDDDYDDENTNILTNDEDDDDTVQAHDRDGTDRIYPTQGDDAPLRDTNNRTNRSRGRLSMKEQYTEALTNGCEGRYCIIGHASGRLSIIDVAATVRHVVWSTLLDPRQAIRSIALFADISTLSKQGIWKLPKAYYTPHSTEEFTGTTAWPPKVSSRKATDTSSGTNEDENDTVNVPKDAFEAIVSSSFPAYFSVPECTALVTTDRHFWRVVLERPNADPMKERRTAAKIARGIAVLASDNDTAPSLSRNRSRSASLFAGFGGTSTVATNSTMNNNNNRNYSNDSTGNPSYEFINSLPLPSWTTTLMDVTQITVVKDMQTRFEDGSGPVSGQDSSSTNAVTGLNSNNNGLKLQTNSSLPPSTKSSLGMNNNASTATNVLGMNNGNVNIGKAVNTLLTTPGSILFVAVTKEKQSTSKDNKNNSKESNNTGTNNSSATSTFRFFNLFGGNSSNTIVPEASLTASPPSVPKPPQLQRRKSIANLFGFLGSGSSSGTNETVPLLANTDTLEYENSLTPEARREYRREKKRQYIMQQQLSKQSQILLNMLPGFTTRLGRLPVMFLPVQMPQKRSICELMVHMSDRYKEGAIAAFYHGRNDVLRLFVRSMGADPVDEMLLPLRWSITRCVIQRITYAQFRDRLLGPIPLPGKLPITIIHEDDTTDKGLIETDNNNNEYSTHSKNQLSSTVAYIAGGGTQKIIRNKKSKSLGVSAVAVRRRYTGTPIGANTSLNNKSNDKGLLQYEVLDENNDNDEDTIKDINAAADDDEPPILVPLRASYVLYADSLVFIAENGIVPDTNIDALESSAYGENRESYDTKFMESSSNNNSNEDGDGPRKSDKRSGKDTGTRNDTTGTVDENTNGEDGEQMDDENILLSSRSLDDTMSTNLSSLNDSLTDDTNRPNNLEIMDDDNTQRITTEEESSSSSSSSNDDPRTVLTTASVSTGEEYGNDGTIDLTEGTDDQNTMDDNNDRTIPNTLDKSKNVVVIVRRPPTESQPSSITNSKTVTNSVGINYGARYGNSTTNKTKKGLTNNSEPLIRKDTSMNDPSDDIHDNDSMDDSIVVNDIPGKHNNGSSTNESNNGTISDYFTIQQKLKRKNRNTKGTTLRGITDDNNDTTTAAPTTVGPARIFVVSQRFAQRAFHHDQTMTNVLQKVSKGDLSLSSMNMQPSQLPPPSELLLPTNAILQTFELPPGEAITGIYRLPLDPLLQGSSSSGPEGTNNTIPLSNSVSSLSLGRIASAAVVTTTSGIYAILGADVTDSAGLVRRMVNNALDHILPHSVDNLIALSTESMISTSTDQQNISSGVINALPIPPPVHNKLRKFITPIERLGMALGFTVGDICKVMADDTCGTVADTISSFEMGIIPNTLTSSSSRTNSRRNSRIHTNSIISLDGSGNQGTLDEENTSTALTHHQNCLAYLRTLSASIVPGRGTELSTRISLLVDNRSPTIDILPPGLLGSGILTLYAYDLTVTVLLCRAFTLYTLTSISPLKAILMLLHAGRPDLAVIYGLNSLKYSYTLEESSLSSSLSSVAFLPLPTSSNIEGPLSPADRTRVANLIIQCYILSRSAYTELVSMKITSLTPLQHYLSYALSESSFRGWLSSNRDYTVDKGILWLLTAGYTYEALVIGHERYVASINTNNGNYGNSNINNGNSYNNLFPPLASSPSSASSSSSSIPLPSSVSPGNNSLMSVVLSAILNHGITLLSENKVCLAYLGSRGYSYLLLQKFNQIYLHSLSPTNLIYLLLQPAYNDNPSVATETEKGIRTINNVTSGTVAKYRSLPHSVSLMLIPQLFVSHILPILPTLDTNDRRFILQALRETSFGSNPPKDSLSMTTEDNKDNGSTDGGGNSSSASLPSGLLAYFYASATQEALLTRNNLANKLGLENFNTIDEGDIFGIETDPYGITSSSSSSNSTEMNGLRSLLPDDLPDSKENTGSFLPNNTTNLKQHPALAITRTLIRGTSESLSSNNSPLDSKVSIGSFTFNNTTTNNPLNGTAVPSSTFVSTGEGFLNGVSFSGLLAAQYMTELYLSCLLLELSVLYNLHLDGEDNKDSTVTMYTNEWKYAMVALKGWYRTSTILQRSMDYERYGAVADICEHILGQYDDSYTNRLHGYSVLLYRKYGTITQINNNKGIKKDMENSVQLSTTTSSMLQTVKDYQRIQSLTVEQLAEGCLQCFYHRLRQPMMDGNNDNYSNNNFRSSSSSLIAKLHSNALVTNPFDSRNGTNTNAQLESQSIYLQQLLIFWASHSLPTSSSSSSSSSMITTTTTTTTGTKLLSLLPLEPLYKALGQASIHPLLAYALFRTMDHTTGHSLPSSIVYSSSSSIYGGTKNTTTTNEDTVPEQIHTGMGILEAVKLLQIPANLLLSAATQYIPL